MIKLTTLSTKKDFKKFKKEIKNLSKQELREAISTFSKSWYIILNKYKFI